MTTMMTIYLVSSLGNALTYSVDPIPGYKMSPDQKLAAYVLLVFIIFFPGVNTWVLARNIFEKLME